MKEIDWKILSVLFEKRSMTKAAESLYMTQSALTKRIKSIEEEWGIEIVKRSSKGVSFTDDGRYLVTRANIMLDFLNEISEHYIEKKQTKELLKIGVPNSFARLHMPRLLSQYVKEYDHLHIKMISNSSDKILQKLVDGSVDMGIICGDFPFLGEKELLFTEQLFVISPKGIHPRDFEKQALISSYLNPIVQIIVDQWWRAEYGSMPHYAHSVPNADIAIEMVKNQLGICFLFGSDWNLEDENIQRVPIFTASGEPVTRNVWLMMEDQCFRKEDLMEFVKFIEDYYEINR